MACNIPLYVGRMLCYAKVLCANDSSGLCYTSLMLLAWYRTHI